MAMKKTGRDATGVNKKVKNAHYDSLTKDPYKGMSPDKKKAAQKSVLDQAWTMRVKKDLGKSKSGKK